MPQEKDKDPNNGTDWTSYLEDFEKLLHPSPKNDVSESSYKSSKSFDKKNKPPLQSDRHLILPTLVSTALIIATVGIVVGSVFTLPILLFSAVGAAVFFGLAAAYILISKMRRGSKVSPSPEERRTSKSSYRSQPAVEVGGPELTHEQGKNLYKNLQQPRGGRELHHRFLGINKLR